MQDSVCRCASAFAAGNGAVRGWGECHIIFSFTSQVIKFLMLNISSRCGLIKAKLCGTEEQTGWFLVAVLHVCNY